MQAILSKLGALIKDNTSVIATRTRQPFSVDRWFLATVVLLLGWGLVMVSSASISIAERQFEDPFYYLWRQLIAMGLGTVAALIILRIPMAFWQAIGPGLVLFAMCLLIAVFIPGLSREINGSVRWIAVGSFSVQPSEFAKLFVLIYLAGYLVRHNTAVRSCSGGFLRPMLVLLILVLLLLLEPDFGAAAVLLVTAMGMMWLAGARLLQFVMLTGLAGGLMLLLAVTSPYRMERLTAFLNPWADPFNSGFQLTQALIAFGRGEWFGVGLGASIQKLFYLPEAHTDFLFAVLAEEFGLFGSILVILAFSILVFRALIIGRRAEQREQPFSGYLAYGLGLWVGLQAFISLGVNMGVLPTKGLTLPLMSYGGNSVLVMCITVALLLRIDYETRKDDRITQKPRKIHAELRI